MHDTPTPTPAAILARLDAGDDAGARAALRAAFAAGPPTAAPAAWARAAEAVGEPVLATAAWQSVLDADPSHRPALRALRALHEERGDTARAAACAARLRALDAPPPAPSPQAGPVVPAAAPDEAEPPPLGAPSHADLVRFAHRFAGRAGVHARMWHDPSRGHGWGPVQGAITPDLVEGHLRGNLTLGTYLVEQGDHTRHLVFDLDVRKAALEAAFGDPARAASLRALVHGEGLRLRAALRAAGLDPLLVDSGYKGRHLWCVFDRPEPAAAVRALGNALAAAIGPSDPRLALEVFPRQDHVPSGGLGNLVKLPLGIHLRTQRRASLLDDDGRPLADPWARLRSVAEAHLPALPPAPAAAPLPAAAPAAPAVPTGPTGPTAALPPGPRFTAGDFEARPRIAAVLEGCAVLRVLVQRGLSGESIPRDGRLVLAHTLGHFPEAVDGVNYLFEHTQAPAEEHMGRAHRGSPISCARIRQRVPDIAGAVPCDCPFSPAAGYPHPLHHAAHLAATAPTAPPDARPLPELLDSLLALETRLAALTEERDAQRRRVTARVLALPSRTLTHEGHTFSVSDEGGIPALTITPPARPT